MKRLSRKVAIVPGAGRGLGKAISEVFAAEGAQVAVLSRTRGNVESTVADIVAAGGQEEAADLRRPCGAVSRAWRRPSG